MFTYCIRLLTLNNTRWRPIGLYCRLTLYFYLKMPVQKVQQKKNQKNTRARSARACQVIPQKNKVVYKPTSSFFKNY
jgi:hypothetical protein